MSRNKKKQINRSKRKVSIEKTSSEKVTISNLDSSNRKELLLAIPVTKSSEPKTKNIDIAMIDAPDTPIAAIPALQF